MPSWGANYSLVAGGNGYGFALGNKLRLQAPRAIRILANNQETNYLLKKLYRAGIWREAFIDRFYSAQGYSYSHPA